MAQLSTTYLGIPVRNPLVVSSSNLTAHKDNIRKAAEAGAGAIVLKSLFEEQIRKDLAAIPAEQLEANPEAQAMMNALASHWGSADYLQLVKDAVSAAGPVPVIASINCIHDDLWLDFAEQLESAGAKALELNIAPFPQSPKVSAKDLEDLVVSIVRNVSVRTRLPLAVKLSPYFTNPFAIVERLAGAGARAVVLFNRLYRFDFDLKKRAIVSGPAKSGTQEYHESLRWIANLYGVAACELVGGTGIHSAETALKFIAAGAQTVQLCSAINAGGWAVLGSIRDEMSSMLDELGYASVDAFRGSLSRRTHPQNEQYERLQYLKAIDPR
ncbi:MAG: dihydroorotate dehydrogenase-like protein [Treponema sp.]|nr:dihydroorotate dehydrogenase-like protein [Treponema sp.]